MDIPKIRTTKGIQPINLVPDEMLLTSCLACVISEDDIDDTHEIQIAEKAKELAQLLEYALIPQCETHKELEKQAGKILRECFDYSSELIAVYPGLGEMPPKEATYIGSIPDGSLYLAKVSSKTL